MTRTGSSTTRSVNGTVPSVTRSRGRNDAGFTLIELMVVVVVIGILLGIAVVTLLSARERAADTAAQARATEAWKAQKVVYTDHQTFTEEINVLEAVEPALDYAVLGSEPAVVKGKVYVKAEGQVVTLVSRSSGGKCFWMKNDASTGIRRYAEDGCDTAIDDLLWQEEW